MDEAELQQIVDSVRIGQTNFKQPDRSDAAKKMDKKVRRNQRASGEVPKDEGIPDRGYSDHSVAGGNRTSWGRSHRLSDEGSWNF